MNEEQPFSSSSLSAMQALAERIAQETPWLRIQDIYEFPRPFVKVWDAVNGIVVGFSSEADYTTYVEIVRREVRRHA